MIFGRRVLGALRLDPSVYTEIEHDPAAIGQAALVVALAGLARGVSAISTSRAAALCAVVVGLLAVAVGLLVRHVISRIDAIIDLIASAATQ